MGVLGALAFRDALSLPIRSAQNVLSVKHACNYHGRPRSKMASHSTARALGNKRLSFPLRLDILACL